MIDENRETIIALLSNINRDGMDKLIEFLNTSDFFTAPASTKYHLCVEGGLAQHSINVFKILMKKHRGFNFHSMVIASILHDLSKVNFYECKENGIYVVNDQEPLGHGEKSVIVAERFIKLTDEERMAIRWHMGYSEPRELWNSMRSAFQKYPFALYLFEADMEASILDEE